jgi:hypothetical protein
MGMSARFVSVRNAIEGVCTYMKEGWGVRLAHRIGFVRRASSCSAVFRFPGADIWILTTRVYYGGSREEA